MLAFAYEIAVVIECASLHANSDVGWGCLRTSDRSLALHVLHVRMSRTIVDDHCACHAYRR